MPTKTIKIPVGLPTALAHSKTERKVLESWLILKTIFNHGYFSMEKKELQSLEKDLNVSYKTIERRLHLAQRMDLVKINFRTRIVVLKSYDFICMKYGCSYSQNYQVKKELHEKIKIENWFEAKAIEEKQAQCKRAFYSKIRKNHMQQIIKERAEAKDLENMSFTKQMFLANVEDYLQGGKNDISYIFKSARADFNVGYRRLSSMFEYKSKGGMAYKKRKLKALGLINIESRSIEHKDKLHTSTESRKTDLGTVIYLPINKSLKLTLPDNITFNSQIEIIKKYETAAA